MIYKPLSLVVLATCVLCLQAADPVPDEDWGYVGVRSSANMFWWLYGSTSGRSRVDTPLVMWLQGGPGGSSTGFGNFIEIGPLDVELKPRATNWVQVANVLFVDNPVGTGYSYVTEDSAYTTDVDGIATDLMTLFSAFLTKYSVFEETPFYIFSESYGGKMAAVFAARIYEAIGKGTLKCNFHGVALGDSWISPVDSVNTWGPYLYYTNLVNGAGLNQVNAMAAQTESAFVAGRFAEATQLWSKTEDLIEELTDNVSFYNILLHGDAASSPGLVGWERTRQRVLGQLHADELTALMNGPIKKKLNIPANVTWGAQSGKVFEKQAVDFMKNVTSTVSSLLKAGVNVTVYSGQLDLIVDTIGTLNWVQKLQWSGLQGFNAAKRVPLYPPADVETKNTGAFLQSYQNFHFYWILKAGHMVPSDAGDMALKMLRMVINE